MRAIGHLVASVVFVLVVALACGVLVHLLIDLLPADAATVVAGAGGQERAEALRHQWRLDRPATVRATDWLIGLVHGDLGTSLGAGSRPVVELVRAPAERTLVLALPAALLTLVIGIGGGIATGLSAGHVGDRIGTWLATMLGSLPEFVLGIGAIVVFGAWLRVAPQTSTTPLDEPVWNHPEVLVLPAGVLGVLAGCTLLRWVRAVIVVQNQAPHVRAARLAGLPRTVVVTRHLLPSCLAPIAQAVVAVLPYLLGGTVVVEAVFAYPGLGSLLLDRARNLDATTVATISAGLAAVSAVGLRAADTLGSRWLA